MYRCPACSGLLKFYDNEFKSPEHKYVEILECNGCQRRWQMIECVYRIDANWFALVACNCVYSPDGEALVPASLSANESGDALNSRDELSSPKTSLSETAQARDVLGDGQERALHSSRASE